MAEEIRRRIRWENKEKQRKRREQKNKEREEELKRQRLEASKHSTHHQHFEIARTPCKSRSLQGYHEDVVAVKKVPSPSPTGSAGSSNSPSSMMEASGPLFSPPLRNPTKKTCSPSTPSFWNDSDDDVDLLRDALMLAQRKSEPLPQKPPLASPAKASSHTRLNVVDATTLRSSGDSHSDSGSDSDLLRDVLLLKEKRTADSKHLRAETRCQDEDLEIGNANKRDGVEPPPPFASQQEENGENREDEPRTPQSYPVCKDSLWSDSDGEMPKPVEKSVKKRKQQNPIRSEINKVARIPARRSVLRTKSETSVSDEGEGNQSDDNIEIDMLVPHFESPKLGPPSDLVPLILKYVGGERIVPASINRYLKGYQREGVVFMHNRISMKKGVIL